MNGRQQQYGLSVPAETAHAPQTAPARTAPDPSHAFGLVRLRTGVVLCWHGTVDDATLPTLREALLLATAQVGAVTLVARDLSNINGAGLAVLADAAAGLRARGGSLRLAAATAELNDLLQRTGLTAMLPEQAELPAGWSEQCRDRPRY